jgi:DNA-binding transcriptional LysR family regulator
VVCASKTYFKRRGVPKTPDDLAAHDCVTSDGLASPTAWTFAAGGATVAVNVRSRLVVNTAEAAIDAAVASVGITRVLSYQVETALRAGKVTLALRDFEPAPWPVSLVYPRQGLLPLKVRAFLDYAAPRLKSRLSRLFGQREANG